MKRITKLVAPNGYTPYAGADITGGVDALGRVVWACTCQYNGQQVQAIFIGTGSNAVALRPTNEKGGPLLNARGSLSIPTGKAYYVGWDKTNERSPEAYLYEVDELPSITLNGGTVTPSTVDTVARGMASEATQSAANALNIANAAKSAAESTARAVAGKADVQWVKDVAWALATSRLSQFFQALASGNRSDATDAYGQDALYGKVQDWK